MRCGRLHIRILLTAITFVLMAFAVQAKPRVWVVDAKGGGDFVRIQDAINSLPDNASEQRIIFIRNGVYQEKVFIDKHRISLIGEDKHKTEIRISLPRDVWRCGHPDDWGVAAVNLKGNDLILENLSITNAYGFEQTQDQYVDCKTDTGTVRTLVRRSGHQMALRSFTTTRLIVRNCILRAFGGDTVSPWNTEDGMFYFKDCIMEGGVDLYCPRGWAWAENCLFIVHGNVAAIWHDGSRYEDSKTVLVNCRFEGEDGFKLGRYHHDAQFYLINSSFPTNMADAPIYLNPSDPQNEIKWGHRVYFYNSHTQGGDHDWHKDNLHEAKGSPSVNNITVNWTFRGKWDPLAIPAFQIDPSLLSPQSIQKDPVAENMLIYQRAIGGWPKMINEIKIDYTKQLTPAEINAIRSDSLKKDATFDNQATTKEIRYLFKAYQKTKNKTYLEAAEKGIRYCLMAQNDKGGWPQFYPDSSQYRAQITYNDHAMVNVLEVLQDLVEQKQGMEVADPQLIAPAKEAVRNGIACILNTQVKVGGKLTAWCAQHDQRTLQPAKARSFELVSLSGMESVGIVSFLMRIPEPTPAIITAVKAAVDWLKQVQIKGFRYIDIEGANTPNGKDRVLVVDANGVVWARFYEIGTNRPFFAGRDSKKKYKLEEIEHERRIGYAWYGTWPVKVLEKEYPAWVKKNGLN